MKRLFFVLISAFLLFSACTDIAEAPESENVVSYGSSASTEQGAGLKGAESDAVYLKVGFDSDSSSRTALPDVTVNKFNYISLMYINDGQDYSSGYTMVGNWDSADELRNATLPFKVGTYYFTLTAVYNEVILEETKQYTIQKGTNSLSFTPRLTSLSLEFRGKGNVNVDLRFNDDNVMKVTGGLYTTQGRKVAGYNDEPLEVANGGKVTYSKNDVPSGSYIVVFKFYADSECKQLLGTYREYASIVNGLTSSSECVLDSVGSLFTINYELNGGAFADGVTRPGSYTRRMGTITLPVYTETKNDQGEITSKSIYKSGYTFNGWYDNEACTGEPVTEIPSGSTGDKTFYAKWIKNATITFSTSEGSFTTTTPSQTVLTGETVCLELANRLGVKNGKKPFRGWSKTTGSNVVEYKDGAEITVTDNITLYAVWGVSEINPADSSDTADYDKDGISDWQEIYVHHTDPASADTDGDGLTDFEELSLYNRNTNVFNPLIADVPQIEVRMTGMPAIKYNYTLSSGKTDSETKTITQGQTGSSSASSSNTSSFSETTGWSESLEVGYSWAVDGGWHVTGKVEANQSKTKGDSYTYEKSESAGWSKDWANGKEKSTTSEKTLTDIDLGVSVVFKNPGNVAYTVNAITLALYRISNNTVNKKVFVKNFTIDDTKVFTLAAGAESGVYGLSAKLNLQDAENFFKYSNGFIVEVSGYKITYQRVNQYENDFTEALTQVRAKTASVYIDFGNESDRAPRYYNTSVKFKYNKDANDTTELYTPVSLKEVLDDILHLQQGVEYTLTSDKRINSIYGIQNTGSNTTGGWFLSHKYTDTDGLRKNTVYVPHPSSSNTSGLDPDISKIMLNAGDEISLVYTVDHDGDGVPLNEELIYGTDDTKEDTDGDGLKDGEEIYGWYKAHLDSKYSVTNKVHTNPVNADTDGDDLWDYNDPATNTATETTRDKDPVAADLGGNAELAVFKYSTSNNDEWKTVSVAKPNENEFYVYTNSDTIYLDIQPAKSLATIEVETEYKEVITTYKDLLTTTPVLLNYGKNIIRAKCISPDKSKTTESYFTVVSEFPSLKNFNAVSKDLTGGKVIFSWSSYVDKRAESDRNGGYYLVGCKGSNLQEDKKLAFDEISGGTETVETSEQKSKDNFAIKLDSSVLVNSRYTLSDLATNTDYCFYLFIYSNSHDPNLFESKLLASKHVKTATTETGTLTFYAHYVNAVKDQDEGCNPQYYWSFHESSCDGLDKWNLSSLDHPCTEKLKEFDDDDDKYFCFKGDMHKYGHEPDKFSGCTKAVKKVVPRTKDYEFSVTWKVNEYDKGSADDDVGTYGAVFKYSKANDTWTIIQGYGAFMYGIGFPKSSWASYAVTITTGQRTNGLVWGIYNESEGEVELNLDIGWE